MRVLSTAAIVVCVTITSVYADDELVRLSEAVGPSVVHLTTSAGATGSGFVAGRDQIVTNYHVVENCESVTVKFRGGAFAKASGVLHLDEAKDIAVIKVTTRPELMRALKIRATLPKQGQDVAAFGNPQGFEFSVTRGIISGIRTSAFINDLNLGKELKGTWIQTDAAISPGNSGGPLVDLKAEVVGINTFYRVGSQNLNFALCCIDVLDALKTAQTAEPMTFLEAFKGRETPASARGQEFATHDFLQSVRKMFLSKISGLSSAEFKSVEAGNIVAAFTPVKASTIAEGQIVRLKGQATIIQILEEGMLFKIGGVKCMSQLPATLDGAELRAKVGDGVITGVPMDYLFYIGKAKAYTTVLGDTSYYILLLPMSRVIDEEAVTEFVRKERELRDARDSRAAKERLQKAISQYVKGLRRTFRDETGRFSLDAVIVGVSDGEAVLIRMEDKVPIKIQVSRLSVADREWIADKESWIRVAGKRVREHLQPSATKEP